MAINVSNVRSTPVSSTISRSNITVRKPPIVAHSNGTALNSNTTTATLQTHSNNNTNTNSIAVVPSSVSVITAPTIDRKKPIIVKTQQHINDQKLVHANTNAPVTHTVMSTVQYDDIPVVTSKSSIRPSSSIYTPHTYMSTGSKTIINTAQHVQTLDTINTDVQVPISSRSISKPINKPVRANRRVSSTTVNRNGIQSTYETTDLPRVTTLASPITAKYDISDKVKQFMQLRYDIQHNNKNTINALAQHAPYTNNDYSTTNMMTTSMKSRIQQRIQHIDSLHSEANTATSKSTKSVVNNKHLNITAHNPIHTITHTSNQSHSNYPYTNILHHMFHNTNNELNGIDSAITAVKPKSSTTARASTQANTRRQQSIQIQPELTQLHTTVNDMKQQLTQLTTLIQHDNKQSTIVTTSHQSTTTPITIIPVTQQPHVRTRDMSAQYDQTLHDVVSQLSHAQPTMQSTTQTQNIHIDTELMSDTAITSHHATTIELQHYNIQRQQFLQQLEVQERQAAVAALQTLVNVDTINTSSNITDTLHPHIPDGGVLDMVLRLYDTVQDADTVETEWQRLTGDDSITEPTLQQQIHAEQSAIHAIQSNLPPLQSANVEPQFTVPTLNDDMIAALQRGNQLEHQRLIEQEKQRQLLNEQITTRKLEADAQLHEIELAKQQLQLQRDQLSIEHEIKLRQVELTVEQRVEKEVQKRREEQQRIERMIEERLGMITGVQPIATHTIQNTQPNNTSANTNSTGTDTEYNQRYAALMDATAKLQSEETAAIALQQSAIRQREEYELRYQQQQREFHAAEQLRLQQQRQHDAEQAERYKLESEKSIAVIELLRQDVNQLKTQLHHTQYNQQSNTLIQLNDTELIEDTSIELSVDDVSHEAVQHQQSIVPSRILDLSEGEIDMTAYNLRSNIPYTQSVTQQLHNLSSHRKLSMNNSNVTRHVNQIPYSVSVPPASSTTTNNIRQNDTQLLSQHSTTTPSTTSTTSQLHGNTNTTHTNHTDVTIPSVLQSLLTRHSPTTIHNIIEATEPHHSLISIELPHNQRFVKVTS